MTGSNPYLHGHSNSVLRSHRWRTAENSAGYLLAELRPSMRVLDVGCGPATITADLGELVPGGMVVGVDASLSVLSEASRSAPGLRLVAADISALPFGDASFDVIHLHQVLQHLDDPIGALAGLRRLVVPGGILAARDADYGAMTWLPDSGGLKRWLALYEACGRAVGGEPDAGRHLARWAADAGFSDVTSTASTWVYETREERAWWGSLWAERVTSSAFAEVALSRGLADEAELEGLADAWRSFGSAPQGRFVVPHGEILCRVD